MKTIFAPITNISKSAIIIIRISGDGVFNCLKQLGISQNLISQLSNQQHNRKAILQNLIHPKTGNSIDQAIITFFAAPKSFTGENIVEIALHNSIYILSTVTNLLLELENVRLAEAGEFSKRAFLNGKIDLLQAEAIVDLIDAETQTQHQQAINQLKGDLGLLYQNWRQELLSISSKIEAFIDFPDDDLPEEIIDHLESRVQNLNEEIKNHLNDNNQGEKIRQGFSLAIIGEPNVGKSSLINYLAQSEVAIVSEIAGTTRDVISAHLNIAGVAVVISDTAGIRQADDKIEQEGVKRALKKAQDADLKILLIDVSDKNEEQNFNQDFIGKLANEFANKFNLDLSSQNTIIVVNKIDLAKQIQFSDNFIAISIKEKINLTKLLKTIADRIKLLTQKINNHSSPLITRARYRQSLNIIVENLSQFSLHKNIELASEDLRLAIREIGRINGKVAVDDILDIIFSDFCIGK